MEKPHKSLKAIEEEKKKREEAEGLRMEMSSQHSAVSHYASTSSLVTDSESEVERRKRGRCDKDFSPSERKKARGEDDNMGSDDDVPSAYGTDPLKNIEEVIKDLVRWTKQPTIKKMLSKPQAEMVERHFGRIREEVNRAREERARLETRVEERGVLTDIVRSTVREELERKGVVEGTAMQSTYAAVAGRKGTPSVPKVTGVKGPVLPPPKLVMIRHDQKESEEVKACLKKIVRPSEIGLKVKRVSNIRNGVIIEAENDEGVENLVKNEALRKAGLNVGKPLRKKPVIMIYDVSSELKDEEIKAEVFARNLQESEIKEEEFVKEFEVKHRYKDKKLGKNAGKRSHIVAECSVRVRNWLRGRERLFIDWQSCRVKDYADVARCYKCQRFGHVAKYCSSAKPGCSFCAEEHDYKDCPNKNRKEAAACANCKREGRGDFRHDAGYRGCPAYERAIKKYSEQIDYGR